MKYVVKWENKLTGETGQGQPISLEDAKAWVEKANREHPDIRHWYEPAK